MKGPFIVLNRTPTWPRADRLFRERSSLLSLQGWPGLSRGLGFKGFRVEDVEFVWACDWFRASGL